MSHATAKVQDIWFKSQRVLRTIVQVGIPSFIAFATVLPSVIDALGLPVDAEVRLWLLAVAAGVTAVAAALSRVMAIPAVNSWLTKVGLGSVPKSAVADSARQVGSITRDGGPQSGTLDATDGRTDF